MGCAKTRFETSVIEEIYMRSETTKTRLNQIINADKEEMNEATHAAAIADFTHVAKEYFETDGINFQIKREKSHIEVRVTFCATRVKNFTVLK